MAGGPHENFQVHFNSIVVCGHIAFSKAASFGRLDPLCQCTQQHQENGAFLPACSVLSTEYCFQSNFVKSDKPSCGNQFLADFFWPSAFVIADVAVCSAASGVLKESTFQ